MDTGRFQIYWVLKTKTFHTKWQVNLAFTYKPVVARSLSRVRLFGTPWTAAHQASLPSASPGVYSNSCSLI